jgi:DNA processing protein
VGRGVNRELLERGGEGFPRVLETLENPPQRLWVLGNTALFNKPIVAIVGTRTPTPYGVSMAQRVAQELAEAGLVVVSGMAVGLDAAAHEGALRAGDGTTIGVLGTGIDRVYPLANRRLYDAVLDRGGLLLTEFKPGAGPRPWNFPKRNRLIAALGGCLLVIEGRHQSGTRHTVDSALQLGREVVALPGRLDEERAQVPNLLIAQGAGVYLQKEDVLCHFGLAESPRRPLGKGRERLANHREALASSRVRLHSAREAGRQQRARLSGAEATLFDLLGPDPLDVEQLATRVSCDAGLLLAALSSLELQGLVEQLPGKRFIRTA